MCVYCNRSQMTSQRVKNKKGTTRDKVEWRDCCSLHAVTSSVIYYSTHTRKNVTYLFYTIKIQMVYTKKKNKSADVIWRGFDVICVCPLIDHSQQPMKMHTEVTLLYKCQYYYLNARAAAEKCPIFKKKHGITMLSSLPVPSSRHISP